MASGNELDPEFRGLVQEMRDAAAISRGRKSLDWLLGLAALGLVGVFMVPVPSGTDVAAARAYLLGFQVVIVLVTFVARRMARNRPGGAFWMTLVLLSVLLVGNLLAGSIAGVLIKGIFVVVMIRALIALSRTPGAAVRRQHLSTDPAVFD